MKNNFLLWGGAILLLLILAGTCDTEEYDDSTDVAEAPSERHTPGVSEEDIADSIAYMNSLAQKNSSTKDASNASCPLKNGIYRIYEDDSMPIDGKMYVSLPYGERKSTWIFILYDDYSYHDIVYSVEPFEYKNEMWQSLGNGKSTVSYPLDNVYLDYEPDNSLIIFEFVDGGTSEFRFDNRPIRESDSETITKEIRTIFQQKFSEDED